MDDIEEAVVDVLWRHALEELLVSGLVLRTGCGRRRARRPSRRVTVSSSSTRVGPNGESIAWPACRWCKGDPRIQCEHSVRICQKRIHVELDDLWQIDEDLRGLDECEEDRFEVRGGDDLDTHSAAARRVCGIPARAPGSCSTVEGQRRDRRSPRPRCPRARRESPGRTPGPLQHPRSTRVRRVGAPYAGR